MLSIYISAAFLWVFFFWVHRSDAKERFRQRVFELRDRLFDLALAGEIRFEDPAYKMLRKTMNGMIQFGYKLNTVSILLLLVMRRDGGPGVYQACWSKAVEDIPNDESRRLLKRLRLRLHCEVLEYVISTSLVLTFVWMIVLACVLVMRLRDLCAWCIRRMHVVPFCRRFAGFALRSCGLALDGRGPVVRDLQEHVVREDRGAPWIIQVLARMDRSAMLSAR